MPPVWPDTPSDSFEDEEEFRTSVMPAMSGYPTEDAYMRACRALHWRTAQLRAHGVEPIRLTDDMGHYPPEDFDFATVEAAESISSSSGDALREALESLVGHGRNSGTWADLVKPLVARFEVAEKLGQEAVHNAEGSAAIAELLREMARKLDLSIATAETALRASPTEVTEAKRG
jgi:hypothetical protein